ncbi:uncharacterized protein LOC124445170 [Xenia sp. Carnegie-2017]|uniref:uncharacterized protein LOC124445170 n=1 Tax=Xenia sp. Carnegie-2017 TaxID=2897299 RepID=UPI001F04F99D|nr:uncharacterized protein LOC124445170 [Xenia sp. Carnegie-2017]
MSLSSAAVPSSRNISDDEKRWIVIGLILNKTLTTALRQIVRDQMVNWHQTLIHPPTNIDKQTFSKHMKTLPPSTLNLNYGSINNNSTHKLSKSAFDYSVKDPLSLAKLFVKPFMAGFNAFDHTMDTSAVLSVMCEAEPFIKSGANALANKVREDIRNKWAHCNFCHWTEATFQTAVADIKALVSKAGFSPLEEKHVLYDVDGWEKIENDLCSDQPVDQNVLRHLQEEIICLKDSFSDQMLKSVSKEEERIIEELDTLTAAFSDIMNALRANPGDLLQKYISSRQEIRALSIELIHQQDLENLYVFHAPDQLPWFIGRMKQIEALETILTDENQTNGSCSRKAALCGLGGTGKTSLAIEHAHRMKDFYKGGVFWLSGANEKNFEMSVNDLALKILPFASGSFDRTLSQTLEKISRIKKSWLLVIDNMDELKLSSHLRKLLSGPWQKNCNHGSILITTRRKPSNVAQEVMDIAENLCIQILCFDLDDGIDFLFSRTGILRNDASEMSAARKLVEELGGLPLALEQAAAYICYLKCPLSSYLETFLKKRLSLINQQQVNPTSTYYSDERLTVQTTWQLNIDHIAQHSEGKNAIRFLNACIYFNPHEIQEGLINAGTPLIDDKDFREFVGTSLGKCQICKLLTDFSLFQQSSHQCLKVHRLVQEVIKDGFSFSEREESFVDAVRLLNHSFLESYSPHQLLSSANEGNRSSNDFTNQSLFYSWRTLCTHAAEIEKNVKELFLPQDSSVKKNVFFSETANIIYQYALYLSAFCRHNEALQAKYFAMKILDWAISSDAEIKAALNLFSIYVFPLPEYIRRHVQYCSQAPYAACKNEENPLIENEEEAKKFEKLRLEGNKLFQENRLEEAVKLYSSVISRNGKDDGFDPRFFSNRASAYLRLGQFKKALQDAEHYISKLPNCWKGYARKALALKGLEDRLGAEMAACQAYYLLPNIFEKYEPFKEFSYLQQHVTHCDSTEQFLLAVNGHRDLSNTQVLFLQPGTYHINKESINLYNIIVIGCPEDMKNGKITMKLKGSIFIRVFERCAVANMEFLFEQGNFISKFSFEAFISNCSFTSSNKAIPSFQSEGFVKIENSCFSNCGAGGLLCLGTSSLRNCLFFGNGKSGLEVREGGVLTAENIYSYNNVGGLLVGPRAKKCHIANSKLYCNKTDGIFVRDSNDSHGDIQLNNNSIFHNDHFGVSVRDSTVLLKKNFVYENNYWGIWLQCNSCGKISHNKVSGNRVGGIRVGKRPVLWTPSVVENNEICDNSGPGIVENINDVDVNHFMFRQIYPVATANPFNCHTPILQNLPTAEIRENKLHGNIEMNDTNSGLCNVLCKHQFCSYCKKAGELKKCKRCYAVEYCDRKCQKNQWKTHKNICHQLLERTSLLLTSTESIIGNQREIINCHFHGLEEVGPNFSKPPPKNGERFIVKVQDNVNMFSGDILSLLIYDRSLTIYEEFESSHVQNLIRDLGATCQQQYVQKKLFMWAAYTKENVIRIFLNDFPPYQLW